MLLCAFPTMLPREDAAFLGLWRLSRSNKLHVPHVQWQRELSPSSRYFNVRLVVK